MFECQYVFFVSQKKVFNHKKNMEFLHNAITKSMPGTIHFPLFTNVDRLKVCIPFMDFLLCYSKAIVKYREMCCLIYKYLITFFQILTTLYILNTTSWDRPFYMLIMLL